MKAGELTELAADFAARGPWITRFEFDGRSFGGSYNATTDPRVAGAVLRWSPLGRVIELGCLEGGHTVMLAPNAQRVIAVDARSSNLERARWIVERFGVSDRVEFVEANVETWSPSEPADVLSCIGVLYHLEDPIAALRRFASWAPRLVLWTHVGAPGHRQDEGGLDDRLSGLHPDSPWPSAPDVLEVLGQAFSKVDVAQYDPGPPAIAAPSLLVYAER